MPRRVAFGLRKLPNSRELAFAPDDAQQVVAWFVTFWQGIQNPPAFGRYTFQEIGDAVGRSHKFIERVLSNRIYVGEFTFGKRVELNHHATLIPAAIFAAVAACPRKHHYTSRDVRPRKMKRLRATMAANQTRADAWLALTTVQRAALAEDAEQLTAFFAASPAQP